VASVAWLKSNSLECGGKRRIVTVNSPNTERDTAFDCEFRIATLRICLGSAQTPRSRVTSDAQSKAVSRSSSGKARVSTPRLPPHSSELDDYGAMVCWYT
jgi:hypothetical protein